MKINFEAMYSELTLEQQQVMLAIAFVCSMNLSRVATAKEVAKVLYREDNKDDIEKIIWQIWNKKHICAISRSDWCNEDENTWEGCDLFSVRFSDYRKFLCSKKFNETFQNPTKDKILERFQISILEAVSRELAILRLRNLTKKPLSASLCTPIDNLTKAIFLQIK